MAETDAQEGLAAGMNTARQFGELKDPGIIVIDAGLGPGRDVGVAFVEVFRGLAVLQIVDSPIGGQPAGEHLVGVASDLTSGGERVAALEQAELHRDAFKW